MYCHYHRMLGSDAKKFECFVKKGHKSRVASSIRHGQSKLIQDPRERKPPNDARACISTAVLGRGRPASPARLYVFDRGSAADPWAPRKLLVQRRIRRQLRRHSPLGPRWSLPRLYYASQGCSDQLSLERFHEFRSAEGTERPYGREKAQWFCLKLLGILYT